MKVIKQAHHLTHHEQLHHTKWKRHQASLSKGFGGGGRTRRYRQGHGRKMQMFKGIMKKGLAMGQKHLLPHIKQIGKNVLLDALEGRNIGH